LALSSAAFSLEFEFKFEFEVEVRMTTPDGPLLSDVTDVRALAAGLPGMRWEWAFARACGRQSNQLDIRYQREGKRKISDIGWKGERKTDRDEVREHPGTRLWPMQLEMWGEGQGREGQIMGGASSIVIQRRTRQGCALEDFKRRDQGIRTFKLSNNGWHLPRRLRE
jgi:hypothetical protein